MNIALTHSDHFPINDHSGRNHCVFVAGLVCCNVTMAFILRLLPIGTSLHQNPATQSSALPNLGEYGF
jgi:hypothetical protein